MKKEDLSKIFIALYAVLLALYVIVIVFAFEKEHFTEAFLMDSVVFISLHLVIPFIYPEKYKEGKVLANVGQLLKNPFFIGYFVLSSVYLCKNIIGYQWYEVLLAHIVTVLVVLFVLEALRQYIAKHYKKELYYYLLFYTISYHSRQTHLVLK